MSTPTLDYRLMAALIADVVGYSKHIGQDERATIAALDQAKETFRVHVQTFRGRIINMVGDTILACFIAAVDAVSAAIAIQTELAKANNILGFRIGIAIGEVAEKPDGTVYGDGINIAARLERLSTLKVFALTGHHTIT